MVFNGGFFVWKVKGLLLVIDLKIDVEIIFVIYILFELYFVDFCDVEGVFSVLDKFGIIVVDVCSCLCFNGEVVEFRLGLCSGYMFGVKNVFFIELLIE